MADRPSASERDGSADRGPTAGPPRWVKVSGIIALAIVVLLLIVLLTGGNHGRVATSHSADTVAPAIGSGRARLG